MQRYISKELFHFVGRDKSTQLGQYDILKIILDTRKLGKGEKNSIGIRWDYSKPISSNEVYTSDMVCFCDIPLNDLKIHMSKYSSFGLSFFKKYLLTQGASPVWYISKNSIVDSVFQVKNADFHDSSYKTFVDLMTNNDSIFKNKTFAEQKKDIEEQSDMVKLRGLNQYLDSSVFPFIKFFDAEKDDTDDENYYMEREWRLIGSLEFKSLSKICRVILPCSFAEQFRKDFPEYLGQITFAGK
jgi:hypothetical protein